MIIVSACLAGARCRYDGRDALSREVKSLVTSGRALPVCPEELGGLSTPRRPAEIINGCGEDVLAGRSRVINDEGRDVTEEFVRGAEEVVRLTRQIGAKEAILKSGSPSCGRDMIPWRGKPIPGRGVAAAALIQAGIKIRKQDRDR